MDLLGPDLSDSKNPIFSDFRDPMIIFADSRVQIFNSIGSLKRLKKTLHIQYR